MNTRTISLLFALLLSSCVTGDKIKRLQPGMDKAQVIQIMGAPGGFRTENGVETIEWTNQLIAGNSWDRADFYADFAGGKLTAWGPRTVRQNRSPVTPIWLIGR